MEDNCQIVFLGGGMMACIMAKCLVDSKFYTAKGILMSARSELTIKKICDLGYTGGTNEEILKSLSSTKTNIIFLCTKPCDIKSVIIEIDTFMLNKDELVKNSLLVSICAGISISTIKALLRLKLGIARIMPNIACEIPKNGCTAYCYLQLKDEYKSIILKILDIFGESYFIPEDKFDVYSALAGSGPAFIMLFIESLMDAAEKHQYPRDVSRSLVGNCVRGCANLLLANPNVHTAEFRDRVISCGGTTAHGLAVLEKNAFKSSIIEAIDATVLHSKKMQ